MVQLRTKEEAFHPEVINHYWFGKTLTLSNHARLDNIYYLIGKILTDNIEGEIIECGVWRGGVVIYARAILEVFGVRDRIVWAADSFKGLPVPQYPQDNELYNNELIKKANYFSVDLSEVLSYIDSYGLLDNQVKFIPGWFSETLQNCEIKKLSILRIDCDYYDSTTTVLENLYFKISKGGYVILDDFGLHDLCGQNKAVVDFRKKYSISAPIVPVDWQCSYWQIE